MIIFKRKLIQKAWVKAYPEAVFGVSNNGWTNKNHGLIWVKDCFDEQTYGIGQQLLLVDSHTSHISVEFIEYCW